MKLTRCVPAYSAACLALSLLPVIGSASAAAQEPACRAPSEVYRFDDPLERVVKRIGSGQPLKIVTIGSSSTAGAGATSPAASYPSRLEAELQERLPGLTVTVVNRGVNGEVATDMVKRFEADVFAEKPDLIIWQVGTNSVLRDQNVLGSAPVIHDGLEQLLATGADVVVMNSQYAPKVLAKKDIERMVDIVGAETKDVGARLFDRFAMMRYWSENEKLSFETFVHPDGLHLNDWSYACVAKVLAAAILDGAKLPVATAKAVPAAPTTPATAARVQTR
jgi:acyl-CoA thioesterase I